VPAAGEAAAFAGRFATRAKPGSCCWGWAASLAWSYFARVFRSDATQFGILDTVSPDEIRIVSYTFRPDETIYIVASKSGTTSEVLALFDHFYSLAGGEGSRFVAITDPGTSLETLARSKKFRRVFLAALDVGGRFSALSHFGLVPAALLGVDVQQLLAEAAIMRRECGPDSAAGRNPGLVLGAILGEAALAGRNKLTILTEDCTAPFGPWVEQLIAESTGKDGKGIVPVDGESSEPEGGYGQDRIFVYLRRQGVRDDMVSRLRAAGEPIIEFQVPTEFGFASEMFRWEFATAVASHVLGVNAFDQPDVEDSKVRAKESLARLATTGSLLWPAAAFQGDGVTVRSNGETSIIDPAVALRHHLAAAGGVGINAYAPWTLRSRRSYCACATPSVESQACRQWLAMAPDFFILPANSRRGDRLERSLSRLRLTQMQTSRSRPGRSALARCRRRRRSAIMRHLRPAAAESYGSTLRACRAFLPYWRR
jgi:transaldolase/glucose-6-phosphate isomerase